MRQQFEEKNANVVVKSADYSGVVNGDSAGAAAASDVDGDDARTKLARRAKELERALEALSASEASRGEVETLLAASKQVGGCFALLCFCKCVLCWLRIGVGGVRRLEEAPPYGARETYCLADQLYEFVDKLYFEEYWMRQLCI